MFYGLGEDSDSDAVSESERNKLPGFSSRALRAAFHLARAAGAPGCRGAQHARPARGVLGVCRALPATLGEIVAVLL